jgi:hypothetical protein
MSNARPQFAAQHTCVNSAIPELFQPLNAWSGKLTAKADEDAGTITKVVPTVRNNLWQYAVN